MVEPGSTNLFRIIVTGQTQTQIVLTSNISLMLDKGLVLRQIDGDLWQVTTSNKAARSIIVPKSIP